MNSFSQVTQIGDSTAGDFSDVSMRRLLPNGWQYQYSIMMFLLPDDQSLDGLGNVPDVYARISIEDIENERDVVIERSIQYLIDQYSIE